MSFEIPDRLRPIRDAVLEFIEQRVYPVEAALEERGTEEGSEILRGLMQAAKEEGLWALGHPEEIGGQGLPFLDYVYINEVVGRSPMATADSKVSRIWKSTPALVRRMEWPRS